MEYAQPENTCRRYILEVYETGNWKVVKKADDNTKASWDTLDGINQNQYNGKGRISLSDRKNC